jgi:hypothetical protein
MGQLRGSDQAKGACFNFTQHCRQTFFGKFLLLGNDLVDRLLAGVCVKLCEQVCRAAFGPAFPRHCSRPGTSMFAQRVAFGVYGTPSVRQDLSLQKQQRSAVDFWPPPE